MTAPRPNALESVGEILARVDDRQPAVFVDFDGTLAPIVERPEEARISERMRSTLARLARVCPVAVVSGRDLSDLAGRVGLEEVAYAGSHGFEIRTADGERLNPTRADEFVDELETAERQLRAKLADLDGLQIEPKRYSLAVHYRRVAPGEGGRVERAVEEVVDGFAGLRSTRGKKVFELQPDLDWHKGRAVEVLLEALGLDRPEVVAFYLGDDVTDEDAFRTLADRGVGVLVRGGEGERPAETAADYELEDSTEVRRFLERLTAAWSGGR